MPDFSRAGKTRRSRICCSQAFTRHSRKNYGQVVVQSHDSGKLASMSKLRIPIGGRSSETASREKRRRAFRIRGAASSLRDTMPERPAFRTSEMARPDDRSDAELTVRNFGHDGRHTVSLTGALDLDSVGALEAAIHRISSSATAIALDLTGLTFIDSSGLWTITTLSKWCTRSGIVFSLIPGPTSVQEVFELTGLIDSLPFVR
jgi:anti-anti-sigma factor